MESPQKLSPIHTYHITHDAVMKTHAGWRVPERYREPHYETGRVRDAVGLIDRSDVVKIDLKGVGLRAWATRIFETDVTPQRACRVRLETGVPVACCWLRNDRGIVIMPSQCTVDAIYGLETDRR